MYIVLEVLVPVLDVSTRKTALQSTCKSIPNVSVNIFKVSQSLYRVVTPLKHFSGQLSWGDSLMYLLIDVLMEGQ